MIKKGFNTKEILKIEPIIQFTLFNFIAIILAEILANTVISLIGSIYYLKPISVMEIFSQQSSEVIAFSLIKFSVFILTIYLFNIELIKRVKIKFTPEQYVLSLVGIITFIFLPFLFMVPENGFVVIFSNLSLLASTFWTFLLATTCILLMLPKTTNTNKH